MLKNIDFYPNNTNYPHSYDFPHKTYINLLGVLQRIFSHAVYLLFDALWWLQEAISKIMKYASLQLASPQH